MSTSLAYCCYTTSRKIDFWFWDILADLIHQTAAKMILKLKEEIRYFRPVWLKEEAIVNASCNARACWTMIV